MENCDSNHSHTTTDWTISEVEFFVFFGRRVHVTVCYICWAHICWGLGTNHYTRYTRLHCMVYGYSCSHVLVSQLTKVSVESKVINKSRGFMRWLYGWVLFDFLCLGQLVSVLILCTSSAATLFALFDRYTNIKYNIIFTAVVYIKKGKYFENAK